jgi:hypothetical protein
LYEKNEVVGEKCELVNNVGKIVVEGKIVAYDPREPVLDDDLGEIDIGVTILNYLKIIDNVNMEVASVMNNS